MAEGKCASCSRYILIGFNLFIWILGLLSLGIGIWLVAESQSSAILMEEIHIRLSSDSLAVLAYVTIAIGAFMFLVGFCGCCGAIRESAIMLGVYILLMVVLLGVELAASIYVALEKSTIEDKLRAQLKSDVINYTGQNNDTGVDFLQLRFRCCGAENFTDYETSHYFSNSSQSSRNQFVPESCCRHLPRTTKPVNPQKCQEEARQGLINGTELNARGCFVHLKSLIDDNGAILAGVGAIVVVIEIVGLVFAVCLCRNRTYYYD